jgi:tyrosine-protein kinase Etk/Wzc
MNENTMQKAVIENPQGQMVVVEDDDEISLLDLAIVLAKFKKLILGLPVLVGALTVGVTLLMTPIFTATTAILPPQQSQSGASALLGQLGGLAGIAGAAAGIKNPSDLYVGMLKSRTVADAMIARFDLVNYYEAELTQDARKSLEDVSSFSAGKDGIITISVDDKDPELAAKMANAYVEELNRLTEVLAVTEASQKRLFFERQMVDARDRLVAAEIEARSAMERGGLASIDAQGQAMIGVTARLRGQISVKEVEIGAMRAFAAEENPRLKAAQQELLALQTELARIEGASALREGQAGAESSAGATNLQLLRNVKYYETLYQMLAQQFELAKIEEAKDSALIQVLDAAIPPERKSKPKRALIVILAVLAAGFVAVLIAFMKEAALRAADDPESAERMRLFKKYLSWRS